MKKINKHQKALPDRQTKSLQSGFAPVLVLGIIMVVGLILFLVYKPSWRLPVPLTSPTPISHTEKIESLSEETTLENGWVNFTEKNDTQWRKYSISRPTDWAINHEAYYDNLLKETGTNTTFEKNGNKIIIAQITGGIGGGSCLDGAKKIGGEHSLYRFRSEKPNKIEYWICQGGSAGSDAGLISYELTSEDSVVLQEMDSIMETLDLEDY